MLILASTGSNVAVVGLLAAGVVAWAICLYNGVLFARDYLRWRRRLAQSDMLPLHSLALQPAEIRAQLVAWKWLFAGYSGGDRSQAADPSVTALRDRMNRSVAGLLYFLFFVVLAIGVQFVFA